MQTSPVQMKTTEFATPTVSETTMEQSGNIVKSPIVGTFYAAPGSDKPSFVKIGDKSTRRRYALYCRSYENYGMKLLVHM